MPKRQKKFLKKLAKKLSSVYSDLGRVENLVNGLNNKQETPLHIAINQNDLPMFKILWCLTDLTIKDQDNLTPLELAIKKYSEANPNSTIQGNTKEMIRVLTQVTTLEITMLKRKQTEGLI